MAINNNAVLNSIVSQALEKEVLRQAQAGAGGMPGAGGGGTAGIDPAAAEAFQSALKAPEAGGVSAAGPVDQVTAIEQPAPSAAAPGADPNASGATADGVPSLGSSILQGIERMRDRAAAGVDRIREKTATDGAGEMTPEQMLKAQWEIRQHALELELMGKVAGKATQNVDTLLKNQ